MRELPPDAPPCAADGHVPHARPAIRDAPDRQHGLPGRWSVVTCRTCGLGGTVPRPTDLAELYPDDYYAHAAAARPRSARARLGAAFDTRRRDRAMRRGPFAPIVNDSQPGALLDVGGGAGDLGAWFVAHGWRVCGVEPSAGACAAATRRGMTMHHGTLDDHPFAPGSFDAVTFNHALEHVPDPRTALMQARDLLKADGLLVVSVPNWASWQRRLFRDAWWQLDVPRHLQHFDEPALAAMAGAASLDVLGAYTSSSLVGLAASLQYRRHGRITLDPARHLRLAYATAPLIALGDALTKQGDVLHLIARRGA